MRKVILAICLALMWSGIATAAELEWYATANRTPTGATWNEVGTKSGIPAAVYLVWSGASVDDSEWIHVQITKPDVKAVLCFISDEASPSAGDARIQVRYAEETDQTPAGGPANTNGSRIAGGLTLTGAYPADCFSELESGWYKVMTITDDAADLSRVSLQILQK